jgi:hypothetical protein
MEENMRKLILLIGLVAFVGLNVAPALAQDDFNFPGRLRDLSPVVDKFEEPGATHIKAGQAGFSFLSIPIDARTAAMADAGIGVIGSASGALYNPAALAFLDGREAWISSVQWIANTDLIATGVTINFPGKGTAGVAFQTYNAGDFNGTAIDTSPAGNGFKDLGKFKTSNYALSVAYGFKITDRFSIGANAKLASQSLGSGKFAGVFIGGARTTVDNSKSVLAFDLGTYFNTGFRNTVLAMSVRNFSSELSYQRERFELPRNVQLGLLFDLVSMMGNTPAPHHLDLATDITNPIDFDERINLGLEYRFAQPGASLAYALRGGYKTNHDTEDYSFGGGIRFKNETGKGFRIDYAFRHFNGDFFDSVNIISGGITF